MKQEVIVEYIRAERTKGCTDDAIWRELRRAGWAEGDIGASFNSFTDSPENAVLLAGEGKLQLGVRLVYAGNAMVAIGVALLFSQGRMSSDSFWPVPSACFFLASLFLTPAAFFFLRDLYSASRSIIYRIWAAFLGLCMASFIPLTIYYFGVSSLALFGPELAKMFPNAGDLLFINFFILLPLQVVTYFFAMLTAIIHRRLLKRRAFPTPSPLIERGMVFMLLAALIGVLGLYLTLNNTSMGF